MIIGIDASRAFVPQRTGIEEYSYQVIKHLRHKLQREKIVLYIRKNQKIGFDLPKKWKVKTIKFPYLWTQLGLSLEMLFHPVGVLFVPSYIVPIIHAKKTVVTIHGLEYEVMPEAYPWLTRAYMRWSTKMSCRWAKHVIAVSRNTKEDLKRLYNVSENKMQVVYEGVNSEQETVSSEQCTKHKPYLLFIGRLEKRKNIIGIIKAFEILKEKYNLPHKLVLAGKYGFGQEDIKEKIENSKHKKDIVVPGFVGEKEKMELLKNADVFLFPTFYEGFGLPVLEAQSLGVPVVVSNISSLLEVCLDSCALVDPKSPEFIAQAAHSLVSDKSWRDDIIEKGLENVKRFNWEKCAEQIAKLING